MTMLVKDIINADRSNKFIVRFMITVPDSGKFELLRFKCYADDVYNRKLSNTDLLNLFGNRVVLEGSKGSRFITIPTNKKEHASVFEIYKKCKGIV